MVDLFPVMIREGRLVSHVRVERTNTYRPLLAQQAQGDVAGPSRVPLCHPSITRFEHVDEVDLRLMAQHVNQHTSPTGDTLQIVHSRHDHLQWMHDHWAGTVVSGEEVLTRLDADDTATANARKGQP